MSSKVVILNTTPEQFLSEKARESLSTGQTVEGVSEEIEKAKEFFGVELISEPVQLSLKLEDFLWKLFTAIKAPESPLRLRAHERFLGEVAAKLQSTIEQTEEHPKLDANELGQIHKFVDDPKEFAELAFNFEFKSGAGLSKSIPLPSSNVLRSAEFLDTLDTLFNSVVVPS